MGLLALAAASAEAQTSVAGNAQNGRQAFAANRCDTCHGSEGQGLAESRPPGPRVGPPRTAFADFDRYVRRPTGQMLAYDSRVLSDATLRDIFAFLQSRPPAPGEMAPAGNAQNGRQVYVRYGCYQCHGYEGQGSQQTAGPLLGPPAIPFSAFRAYTRQPTGAMPPYTSQVLSDAALADMYAFLQSRPAPAELRSIPLLNE
jgi:mono/diheme cytochrome c family protein